MIGFIKSLLGKKQIVSQKKRDPQRYDEEKRIAHSDDEAGRLSLAQSSETHQEILYYLAEKDPSAKVRREVARNMSTPVQASPILAGDVSADVRMSLAEKLVRLLPDLSHDKHSQLYAFAAQALGTLALDEVLKIRKALSTALKDSEYAPPQVASQLARDIEQQVAEPILLFCTALTDKDLLEILKEHPASWTVQAIAGRKRVSGLISQAIIDTKDRPGGQVLIRNEGAQISNELLKDIIEQARNHPEWQAPLAQRKGLPPKMAKTLAGFADKSVRKLLLARDDLDAEAIEEITEIFKRRLDFAGEEKAKEETPAQRAQRLQKSGKLTPDTVMDALAMRDREFVYAALALMAKTSEPMVEKIFDMKAPKPIVALCWRAGMPMRMTFKMQQELGQVPPKELVYPRDGTDYPLSDDELLWQLEFVGVQVK